MKADEIIKMLHLEAHPCEGGYFRETYRSRETLSASDLPERYGASRTYSTAIYYLLTAETRSLLHRVKSDEVWHHYQGAPVTLLLLYPDGTSLRRVLGNDIAAGQLPQLTVEHGVWQGAFIAEGEYALMGNTVAPGFEYADFEHGRRAELCSAWPLESELIIKLTQNEERS